MRVPGFSAQTTLYRTSAHYAAMNGFYGPAQRGAVLPQQCASSPCLRLGGGRFCITLPIVGRRCVNIPYFGSWRVRCCLRWWWPPVSCSVQRC